MSWIQGQCTKISGIPIYKQITIGTYNFFKNNIFQWNKNFEILEYKSKSMCLGSICGKTQNSDERN